MGSGVLIPDRRRKYFPRNGGPRPTATHKSTAQTGLEAARAALAEVEQAEPRGRSVLVRLTADQVDRARRGIALARKALEERVEQDPSAEN